MLATATRLGCFLVPLLGATRAMAQTSPPEKPPFVEIEEEKEPTAPLIPNASDKLGGHLLAGASGAFVAPFGHLEDGAAAGRLGNAWGASLDLGFGLSRTVALGAWGQYTAFGSNECIPSAGVTASDDCSASSFAVGPFLRYHLVQGVRFDPWVMLGVGYRRFSVDSGLLSNPTYRDRSGKQSFSGIDFMHLVVGGDFYLFRAFGFGPFLELNAGTLVEHPDSSRDGSVYGTFSAGLRLALDLPGR
jgi:hypothetical protein